MSFNGPRRYRSDDRDIDERHDLDLMVLPPDGNGDWYVSILPHGHRLGPAVRVTTSGSPHGQHGVCVAIAQLYRAMGGEDELARPRLSSFAEMEEAESAALVEVREELAETREELRVARADLAALRAAARVVIGRDIGRDPGEVKTSTLVAHLRVMAEPSLGELVNARASAGAARVEAEQALRRAETAVRGAGGKSRKEAAEKVRAAAKERLREARETEAAARAAEEARLARCGGKEN